MIRVFFDGKCLFCIKVKQLVEKVDVEKRISFFDLWKNKSLLKKNGIGEEAKKEIHLITDSGQIFKGYFAIKHILLNVSLLHYIGNVVNTFVPDRLGMYIYSFVARNRLKIIKCERCLISNNS